MDHEPTGNPGGHTRSKAESGAVARAEDLNPLLPDGSKKRILTGDRTTGRLHIGHYIGSLKARVELQHKYDTFILMADVQALTTHYDRPEVLKQSVRDVALDYMAVGLIPYTGGEDDGTRCKIVIQSMVPAIAELTVYYGLLIPMSLILDNPTTKAEAEQQGVEIDPSELDRGRESLHKFVEADSAEVAEIKRLVTGEFPEVGDPDPEIVAAGLFAANASLSVSHKQELLQLGVPDSLGSVEIDKLPGVLKAAPSLLKHVRDNIIRLKRATGLRQVNYGFLGYPVSQAADITFVGAHLVPVGEDQVPHIELTREIVRRFNNQYGQEVLVAPQALIGGGIVKGLDGNAKMSKSLDNAIYLSDGYDEIWRRVRQGVTDPQRVTRKDPGRPEMCNIFSYHELFNEQSEPVIHEAELGVPSVEETAHLCRTAGFGCIDCKKNLARKLDAFLQPMRERRAYWEAHPEEMEQVLKEGTRRGIEEGEKTLSAVRQAMHLDYFAD